jgi:hypothetical protein
MEVFMGRKGVSKRKTPKSKIQPISGGNGNGAVTALAQAANAAVPQSPGKEETMSIGIGGKKKTADTRHTNKK